jgi:hypothetical protein
LNLPGNVSRKMIRPNTAVSMKLALVLMTLTRTVLLARVRARVKSPHIIPLNNKFSPKKDYNAEVRYWPLLQRARIVWSDTYASYKTFDDHALIFQAEEVR